VSEPKKKAADIRLSVSKIETYLLCPLKWYWAYVMNLPVPETPAKALGSEVHELCENYLKIGKEPHKGKSGAILRAGLHLLPPVGSVRVEEWTRLENIGAHPLWRQAVADGTIGADWEAPRAAQVLGVDEPYVSGANLVGKIDMHLPRLSDLPQVLEPRDRKIIAKMGLTADGLLYVSDLKTTGDFRWSKSGIELATNTQMMAYAYVIGVQAYENEGVRWNTPDGSPAGALVEHVQVRTKGQPMAKRERAVVRWAQIEKNMGTIDKHSREMLKLSCKGEAEVRDNPKNARPTGCSAYGGCPFQTICPHSPTGRSRGKPIPSMNARANTTTAAGVTMSTKAGDNKAKLFPNAAPDATAKAAAPAAGRTPSAGTGAKAPVATGKGTAKAGASVGKGAGAGLNPPDAAPSAPPVDPEAGVNLIRENIDMSDGALAIGFGKKLIAKLGCDFDAVIAAGNFIVEDDVIYNGTAVEGADDVEAAVEGDIPDADIAVGEDGIPLDGEGVPCYKISELKPGKFRVYTPEGEAIQDAEGTIVFATWDAAHAAGWAVATAVPEEVVGDEPVAEEPEADVAEQPTANYQESKAYVAADAQAKLAIDNLFSLAEASATGALAQKEVDEIIKTACNIKRLHAKTRDEIVAAGVEAGAFAHAPDGIVLAGAVAAEPPSDDVSVDAVVEEPAVEGEPQESNIPEPMAMGFAPPLVILVDALAVGQQVEDLSAYLAVYEDEVAVRGLDVRGEGAQYGKGGKAVASLLLISCMSEPLTGWWAISSRHPYAEEVISILVRFGAVVVRGVR
jgi:hypothetical protein